MQQQLRDRLEQLKSEFERGQKALAETDVKAKELRDTLLRISGAIQVLEEELAKESETREDSPIPHPGTLVPQNGGTGS